jgi:hypothetical protein
MGRNKTGLRNILAKERSQRAFTLRKAGASYGQIGLEIGVSAQAAHKMVMKVLDAMTATTHEEGVRVKKMEQCRLDEMQLNLWAVVTDQKATLSDRMQAMDRVFKIMERRSKYDGLDNIPESVVNMKTEVPKIMAPVQRRRPRLAIEDRRRRVAPPGPAHSLSAQPARGRAASESPRGNDLAP